MRTAGAEPLPAEPARPRFDPQATFARLSAEELREDPGDHFVALVIRHLPALVHHRGPVAVDLVLLGLAKLAAGPMWQGREWGGYVLAAANGAVLVALVFLLHGWVPGRRPGARITRL